MLAVVIVFVTVTEHVAVFNDAATSTPETYVAVAVDNEMLPSCSDSMTIQPKPLLLNATYLPDVVLAGMSET